MWQWLLLPPESKQHRWEDAAAARATTFPAPYRRDSSMGGQGSLASPATRDSAVTAQLPVRELMLQETAFGRSCCQRKVAKKQTMHGCCYRRDVKCNTGHNWVPRSWSSSRITQCGLSLGLWSNSFIIHTLTVFVVVWFLTFILSLQPYFPPWFPS